MTTNKYSFDFVGVIARDPSFLPYIKEALTEEAVSEYFKHVFEDYEGPLEYNVLRYIISIKKF